MSREEELLGVSIALGRAMLALVRTEEERDVLRAELERRDAAEPKAEGKK